MAPNNSVMGLDRGLSHSRAVKEFVNHEIRVIFFEGCCGKMGLEFSAGKLKKMVAKGNAECFLF